MNNFRSTFRYLWSNRLFTGLNILGLSVGISTCWLIFVIVHHESQYNKEIPDGDRIFQVASHLAGVPRPMVGFIEQEIPGIELAVPVHLQFMHSGKSDTPTPVILNDPDRQIATTTSYFDLVPYEWLAGDKNTALDAPNKIVLTKSRASQYFPEMDYEDVYGRGIFYNDSLAFVVSGVVSDLPYQSSFEWQEFFQVSFDNDHWLTNSWNAIDIRELLYVKLASAVSSAHVAQQIDEVNILHNKEYHEKYQFTQSYRLLPLSELHYAADLGGAPHRTVAKNVLYGLIGVAIFLILLAIINYVNLSTAQLPRRTMEIGIRKTLGSQPSHLVGRFFAETLAITLFAVAISVAFVELFSWLLVDFLPPNLEMYRDIGTTLLFLAIVVSLITLLAGIYPAWLITKVGAMHIFRRKNSIVLGGAQLNFRKTLVVFQFVVALLFISCSIILGQQLRFTLSKDLGFEHQAIITVNVPNRIHQHENNIENPLRLKRALDQHPDISSTSIGDLPLDRMMGHTRFFHHRDSGVMEATFGAKYVDEDYLGVFEMDVIAGKNVDWQSGSNAYIINEAAVKAFGFASAEDAIGKMIARDSESKPHPISGVVRNFHQRDFRNEISPIVLMFGHYAQRDIHIKLVGRHPLEWRAGITKVALEWKSLYPDTPFEYRFYDEIIADLYLKEHQASKLIGVATGITIFISCLGLFGLVTLAAVQRTKEIGIRKVLGASITGIVAMLSKDFVKMVLIAIAIASPIAWWAMNQWLQDFAYRIDIQWWMFAVAGFAAVLIALLTVSWQAIRAAVANPVDSLRDE